MGSRRKWLFGEQKVTEGNVSNEEHQEKIVLKLVYEINTRCWLRELSGAAGHSVTLENVPPFQFADWKKLGFTHVWLMGVWTTGPRSRAHARSQSCLRELCAEAFPNSSGAEIDSSPYAIADYSVAQCLGGESGLRKFRGQLLEHGMKLLLDFVPNHAGLDHPWLARRPDLLVQSPREMPETFSIETPLGIRWIAYGKDPYFPAWRDTVQLDYRAAATRAAMIEVLQSIADRCDGVRCDMAMLLLNDVFTRTWERFPSQGAAPPGEFWRDAIRAVKRDRPEFLFLAEAYWNLESRLQGLGFDYVYDKRFYDHLVRREWKPLQQHLRGLGSAFATVRFLENHDEPRIAASLTPAEQKPAALLLLNQPEFRLLHDGQLTGKTRRTPVQLTRYLPEPPNAEIAAFYENLLMAVAKTDAGCGEWTFVDFADADRPQNINDAVFGTQWQKEPGGVYLSIVNMGPQGARFSAKIAALEQNSWVAQDLLNVGDFAPPVLRPGGRVEVELPPYGARLLQFSAR